MGETFWPRVLDTNIQTDTGNACVLQDDAGGGK